MFPLILQIVFVLSLGGMVFLAANKAPALLVLPETGEGSSFFGSLLAKIKQLSFEPKNDSGIAKEKRPIKIKTADLRGLEEIDQKNDIDSDGGYWAKLAEK